MAWPKKRKKEKQEEDYREKFMDNEYLIEKIKGGPGSMRASAKWETRSQERLCHGRREAKGSQVGQSFYSSTS